MSVVENIDSVVRDVLRAEGFDLILVERSGKILRLFIDRLHTTSDANPVGATSDGQPVQQSVSVEDCATVSRLVSDTLDVEGLTDDVGNLVGSGGGAFNLEVSSPGLDRPLVRPADFLRFLGCEVRLRTHQAVQMSSGMSRKLTGELRRADPTIDGAIAVAIDNTEHRIAYDAIERARLVPQW